MMKRRSFLKICGLSAAAVTIPNCLYARKNTSSQKKPPNIVFIMADDLGYGDLTCYNPDCKIPTPNIDRLSELGIRCTDAHSPSAVCSPTRYGVLTGRYAWRTRLKKGVLDGFSEPLISQSRTTIAEMFKRKGYRTACIGKWHLGLGWQSTNGEPIKNRDDADRVDFTKPLTDGPNHHGFDYSFITAACSTVDPPYVFIENGKCTDQPTEEMVRTGPVSEFGSRPGPMVPGWSRQDVDPTYVKKTISFIRNHQAQHSDRPFFVYLALSAPHAPWLPPDFIKGKSGTGPRGDLVALVDWCVGRVTGTLKQNNLTKDTLIIFTSDNGPRIGKKGHKSSGKFRGYKSHVWEGGHRVPFIASWPGKIKPATISEQLICLTDLMASCAVLTGAGLSRDDAPDSLNFMPILLNSKAKGPVRDHLISHSSKGVFAIRKGDWKLILDTKGSGGWVGPWERDIKPNSPGQLYNLANDPYEHKDLWDKRPDIVKRLSEILEKYKQQGHTRPPWKYLAGNNGESKNCNGTSL